VVLPSGLCITHDAEHHVSKRFLAGPDHQPGPGGKKKPGAHDVLRELVERQVEKVLAPFIAALDSDDLDLAMRAGRELMDRSWGKPKQAVDMQHDVGETLAELLAPTPLEATHTRLPETGWEGTDG
jgi:truncated hemoglobin YjbI